MEKQHSGKSRLHKDAPVPSGDTVGEGRRSGIHAGEGNEGKELGGPPLHALSRHSRRSARARSRARTAQRSHKKKKAGAPVGRHAAPPGKVAGFTRNLFSPGRIALVAVVALLALFFVSFFSVLSEASAGAAFRKSIKAFHAPEGCPAAPPSISAVSGILIDASSGKVVFEKNSHQALPIASTTKVVTALVARDRLSLKETVTVSESAAAVGEQSAGLKAGNLVTVEDLLWALMVLSANDAGAALAERVSGSVEAFSELMNEKVRELGGSDSNFLNPHGLDQDNHFSSAHDLALCGKALLEDPVLAEMAAAKSRNIPMPNGSPGMLTLYSHNEFLSSYEGANGIKTGYTGKAGTCLVGSATRDGMTFVTVVLNSQNRSADTAALLDYGFSSCERILLVEAGQGFEETRTSAFPEKTVPVVAEESVSVVALKGSGDAYTLTSLVSRESEPDIAKGDPVGVIECTMNGELFARVRCVAATSSTPENHVTRFRYLLWYSTCKMGNMLIAPLDIL